MFSLRKASINLLAAAVGSPYRYQFTDRGSMNHGAAQCSIHIRCV
jgi:hypothetical protein